MELQLLASHGPGQLQSGVCPCFRGNGSRLYTEPDPPFVDRATCYIYLLIMAPFPMSIY